MRKTPLAEVFHFFRGNSARKGLDVWRVVDDDDYCQAVGETPSGRYDEHSSKSFPSVRNQGLLFRRRADKRLKVMQIGFITLQQGHH
jgi:hypothetical protein